MNQFFSMEISFIAHFQFLLISIRAVKRWRKRLNSWNFGPGFSLINLLIREIIFEKRLRSKKWNDGIRWMEEERASKEENEKKEFSFVSTFQLHAEALIGFPPLAHSRSFHLFPSFIWFHFLFLSLFSFFFPVSLPISSSWSLGSPRSHSSQEDGIFETSSTKTRSGREEPTTWRGKTTRARRARVWTSSQSAALRPTISWSRNGLWKMRMRMRMRMRDEDKDDDDNLPVSAAFIASLTSESVAVLV